MRAAGRVPAAGFLSLTVAFAVAVAGAVAVAVVAVAVAALEASKICGCGRKAVAEGGVVVEAVAEARAFARAAP